MRATRCSRLAVSRAAYKAVFTKTLMANNGVVYVMNRVISPRPTMQP